MPSLPRFADFVKALWALQGISEESNVFAGFYLSYRMMEANKNPREKGNEYGPFLVERFLLPSFKLTAKALRIGRALTGN